MPGKRTKNLLAEKLGVAGYDGVDRFVKAMYERDMSTVEIAEWIDKQYGLLIGARNIQRWLVGCGVKMRSRKESWGLARKKGRVVIMRSAENTLRSVRRNMGKDVKREIFDRDKYRCAGCGEDFSEYKHLLEIDHIVPIHRGGEDSLDNLQLLCWTCHGLKTSDERSEYAKGRIQGKTFGVVSGRSQEDIERYR